MEIQNLTKEKPAQMFKVNDKVLAGNTIMLIGSHYGYILVDNEWINQYICVPINKKGLPDLRSSNKRRNSWKNIFSETNLVEVK